MWASVAGSLGNPDALDYLQTITPDMKESDVLTSQARAREWIKQHPRDTEDDPSINILYHK